MQQHVSLPGAVRFQYPLSPIQQGMLLHMLAHRGSGFDIEQMVLTMRESLDPAAFRVAWEQLVARHDVFRTSFAWENLPEPEQRVHESVALPWAEFDWTSLAEEEQETRFSQYLESDRREGFDPATAPLVRCTLFRFGAEDWRFVWTFHHMLADGQSYVALIREAFDHYEAARAGVSRELPEPKPYREFITWQREHQKSNADQAEKYWRNTLHGFTAPTTMPESASNARDYRAQSVTVTDSAKLANFARTHGLTINGLVQAAWAMVLSRNSGEQDVVFGVTRACRKNTIPGADEVTGLFINTVPVRVRMDREANVATWLTELNHQRREVRDYEHTPLVDVQKWSDIPAGTSLFQSLIVFTPHLIGNVFAEQGGAWTNRKIEFHERTNYPLTLFAYGEQDLLLKLSYDAGRFSDTGIARWLAQLTTILHGLAASPDRRLADVPYLSDEERDQLLTGWNQTQQSYDSTGTIHREVEKQAALTPDAVALSFRDQSMTYRELNRRANLLAYRLRQAGIGPEKFVGIYATRSIEMTVGLLAVLKAGAAYVPLDPKYPRERLGWMLEDTRASVILTQDKLLTSLPLHPCEIISLDNPELWDASNPRLADGAGDATGANLAYVLFTSGSSGRPKGVMIEHRNVMNFFVGMDETLDHRTRGTWLAVTSISFDISVLELFWTLSRGFKVVIQSEEDRIAPAASQSARKMDFSLFYFSADAAQSVQDKYRLLLEGAKFADMHGFSAVWTPERHFHEFGGLYPNPAVTGAAIAAITKNVQIRAGSIVLPLHNPIRVAEEWAVVDNISGGRVGLSFASGWHKNDFALMPQNWTRRKEVMMEGIDAIRKLWRGEKIAAKNGTGEDIEVGIYPAPLDRSPKTWITTAGNIETFRAAGVAGTNILTNLLGQKTEELQLKIAAYHEAWKGAGHVGKGSVTLMLHTFVGADTNTVRETVRRPFIEYLKTSTELVKQARWEFPAFAQPGKDRITPVDNADLNDEDLDALMSHAFARYFETSGLFGSVDDCLKTVERMKSIGVDEIACLLDFGVATDQVLASLEYLNQLREHSNSAHEDYSMATQIRRHSVTHLQCTPSMGRMLAAEPESLNALGNLEKLLLGGEALPPGLASQLKAALRGDLINMYGPTETTVWSTTAKITGDVTIGRPIANTTIYIVDAHMQPTPIDVPGELLIGGEGVARGYLHRADLTAERFLTDPFQGAPARVYRTGDLARYREDGSIEYLRRLDSQVKIRGHRIELGDIEAAIAEHPGVWETAVMARPDASGDPQLVAYVVPQSNRKKDQACDVVERWGSLWDETYRDGSATPQADWNLRGWQSSYTGSAIPEAEMKEWVDATVARIRALKPRRVLEIGCGTGLLLFRVAPDCEYYEGVDLSDAALDSIEKEAVRRGLGQVQVRKASAADLADIAPGSFDTVIINSVIQYFPSGEYLAQALEQIVPAIAPGGTIFVGDVRNRDLLKVFHTSVEVERASAATPIDELRRRIDERCQSEHELLVAPDLFHALAQRSPRIGSVTIQLKRGTASNEMTRFRYDVVLRIRERFQEKPAPIISGENCSIESMRAFLAAKPDAATFSGVLNERLTRDVRTMELLDSENPPHTIGELRTRIDTIEGIDPEDLWTLDANYDVIINWSNTPGRFDATFRRRGALRLLQPLPATTAHAPIDWSRFVNRRPAATDLTRELRDHVAVRRPDYMVPAAFVMLAELPRTPNGKVDWKSLPEPDRVRQQATSFVAPSNQAEQIIADVWKQLLNLDRVGADDNFFDLGANSLMMVQAVAPLRDRLRCSLSLVDLFRYPSARALAKHVEGSQQPAQEIADSHKRGRARLDAILRRVHAREIAAEEKGA